MFDLIVIGGSAAGTAASIYASRRGLNMKMISQDFGGEVALGGDYLNYPGIPVTTGIELTDKFKEHLGNNNVEPELGVWVERIEKKGEGEFVVHAKKNEEDVTYEAKAVVVATGVHPRELGVPGEQELKGKGVTYCTTCDGPLFRNKKVVTIGGGNSAMESALMLADIADHVTLLNINDRFKGEEVLETKVNAHEKIDVIYNGQTLRLEGEPTLQTVVYLDKETQEEKSIQAHGAFVHIGLVPNSDLLADQATLNNFKEIEVDQRCETTVRGIFAAGDVTNVPYKQAVIAAGQGACAALSAVDYINKL
jgi:alkyl hydroperoxide reductase subunit AhpF